MVPRFGANRLRSPGRKLVHPLLVPARQPVGVMGQSRGRLRVSKLGSDIGDRGTFRQQVRRVGVSQIVEPQVPLISHMRSMATLTHLKARPQLPAVSAPLTPDDNGPPARSRVGPHPPPPGDSTSAIGRLRGESLGLGGPRLVGDRDRAFCPRAGLNLDRGVSRGHNRGGERNK